MCSLRFKNNSFSIYCVRFASKNNLCFVGGVRFSFKIVFLLSNVFASLRKYFLFYRMCLLRFENNLLIIEGVRFASISKKTPLSKLSFAFVSLALPLLLKCITCKRYAMSSNCLMSRSIHVPLYSPLAARWPISRPHNSKVAI